MDRIELCARARWATLLLVVVGFGAVLLAGSPAPAFGAPRAQAPTPTPTAAPAGNDDPATQAGKLGIEGSTLLAKGDAQGAITKLTQALSLFQQAGSLEGQSVELAALGQAYSAVGQYDKALDVEQQALAIARQILKPSLELIPLQRSASIYATLGKFDAALSYYQQAIDSAQNQGDTGLQLTALLGQSSIYRRTGQYDKARATLQQVLSVAQASNDQSSQVTALLGLARVSDSQGQYLQALDYNQQALALAQAALQAASSSDPLAGLVAAGGINAAVNNIGTLYSSLGQPAKALEYYQQALTIAQSLNNQAGIEDAYNNIGDAYSDLGQYDQALAQYQQSLSVAQSIGDQAGVQTALNNIGFVYENQKQYPQALDNFQQALKLAQDLNDRSSILIAYNNLGGVYDDLGQYDPALAAYKQSLAIATDLGDPADQEIALSNIGYLYDEQGNTQQALDYYQQALTIQETIRSSVKIEEFKSSVAAGAIGLYQRVALTLNRLGRTSDAFNTSEQARARAFLDQLGNAPLDLSHSANPQLAQQEQDLRSQISALDLQLRQERSKAPEDRNKELVQSLSSQLQSLQQQYGDVLTQLKLSDPQTASLVSVAPLSVSDVQSRLDTDTTLLSYLVTPKVTLAFLVTRTGLQEVDLPVKQTDLQAAVAAARGFTSFDPQAAPDQSYQQLYQWLVAPLAGSITTSKVTIVPDGILNYLPFAALTDGQSYFGDQHALYELPSASVMQFIHPKGSDGSALVLAQSQAAGFPTLQYADQEAQNVAALFGTQPLLGPDATVTAVKQNAGSVSVLHLAAHADLNTSAPLFSRILLAPDAQSDGSLTVQEVYGLNLAATDLVVLSACQTQLGGPNPGDDFVALNRAFIYAGAPSVVASLWAVNDQSTSVLMTSFYEHLQAGMTKAAALQAAQADTRARFPNPYYWAGFVLTGDPGS